MISLFYSTINPNERQFIVAILPDTGLITEPKALLHLAFYLVNLQGIVAPYPRARLLIVEIVMCVAFLERQIKGLIVRVYLEVIPDIAIQKRSLAKGHSCPLAPITLGQRGSSPRCPYSCTPVQGSLPPRCFGFRLILSTWLQ